MSRRDNTASKKGRTTANRTRIPTGAAGAKSAETFARNLLTFWNNNDTPDWLNDALVDAVVDTSELFNLPNPFAEPEIEQQIPLLKRVLERAGPLFTLRRAQPPVALDTFTDTDVSALIHEFMDFGRMDDCAALLTLLEAITYTDDMHGRETMLEAARRRLLPYLPGSDELAGQAVKRVLFWLRRDEAQKGEVRNA